MCKIICEKVQKDVKRCGGSAEENTENIRDHTAEKELEMHLVSKEGAESVKSC